MLMVWHCPKEDIYQCELKLHKGSGGAWSLNQFFATLIYVQYVTLSRKNEITSRSSSPDVVLVQKYHNSSGKATVQ